MNKISKLLLAGLSVIAMQSCDLERTPLTSLNSETFWNNPANAELALTAIYRCNITGNVEEYGVTDFWSYQGLQLMEHLTDCGWDKRGVGSVLAAISSGRMTASTGTLANYWSSAYRRIGRCNRFLEGVQSMADGPKKTRLIADVRFMRATQYHYLASYFYDVPLVTTVLTGEESNNVTKETRANILAWCAKEFTEAAADLPRFSEIPGSEKGRACKQAALAFAGRTYMLMEDWTNGAKVYKEIIDLRDNEINPSYSPLFLAGSGNSNKENIFYIEYLANFFGWGYPQHTLPAKDGGWSLSNPTDVMFQAYEFLDGTPFSYDDPRYNPANLGENRDPRLDYTMLYDGAMFKGSPYQSNPDNVAPNAVAYGGDCTRTGYIWRKFFDDSPIEDIKSYSCVVPIIRYAEVLLGYMECVLEGGTLTQDVLDNTINLVRGRADVHMPAITLGSKEEMRKVLHHERQVEFPMEGIRYWDIMRWKECEELLTQEVWGAPYPYSATYATKTKKVDPTGNCRWYVDKRDFRAPQDYRWPIPQSEQNINPNLRD